VPGQQQAQVHGPGQLPQLPERPEVVAEVAVVRDDRGATAQHGIPGEQRAVRGQQQADGIGGVTGSRDDPQIAARRRDDVAVAEALGAQPARRIGRLDGRPAQLGQPGRPGGVIEVPVRQQDPGDPAVARDRLGLDPAQVLLIVGPGVDHDDR